MREREREREREVRIKMNKKEIQTYYSSYHKYKLTVHKSQLQNEFSNTHSVMLNLSVCFRGFYTPMLMLLLFFTPLNIFRRWKISSMSTLNRIVSFSFITVLIIILYSKTNIKFFSSCLNWT